MKFDTDPKISLVSKDSYSVSPGTVDCETSRSFIDSSSNNTAGAVAGHESPPGAGGLMVDGQINTIKQPHFSRISIIYYPYLLSIIYHDLVPSWRQLLNSLCEPSSSDD